MRSQESDAASFSIQTNLLISISCCQKLKPIYTNKMCTSNSMVLTKKNTLYIQHIQQSDKFSG